MDALKALRTTLLPLALLTPQTAYAEDPRGEIRAMESTVATRLKDALNAGNGCEAPLFVSEAVPPEGVEASGSGFVINHSEPYCQEEVCGVAVAAAEDGKPLGMDTVTAVCPSSSEIRTRAQMSGFNSYPNLNNLRPFPKAVEYSPEGFPVINPHNYLPFLESQRGKNVIVIFTTEFCTPCKALRKKLKEAPPANSTIVLVDLDHPRYLELESRNHPVATAEAQAFARALGLSTLPESAPTTVLLKYSGAWTGQKMTQASPEATVTDIKAHL